MNEKIDVQLLIQSLKSFSQAKLLNIIEFEAKRSQDFVKYLKVITNNDDITLNDNRCVELINMYINSSNKIDSEEDYDEVLGVCVKIIDNIKLLYKTKHYDKILLNAIDIIRFFSECIDNEANFANENQVLEDIYRTIVNDIKIFIYSLKKSTIKLSERLKIAIYCNHYLLDLSDIFAVYLENEHSLKAWNEVATNLLNIINNHQDQSEQNIDRNCLIEFAINALHAANRDTEIIDLCIAESEPFEENTYIRLVRCLYDLEEYSKVIEYAEKAKTFSNTSETFHDTIESCLKECNEFKHSLMYNLYSQVEEFVKNYQVDIFAQCKEIAEKLSMWNKVRHTLLTFLQNGTLPWNQTEWPAEFFDLDITYPECELKKSDPKIARLLDVAIYEKNYADIIYWYDQYVKKNKSFSEKNYNDNRILNVADSLQDYDLGYAISIYQKMISRAISTLQMKNYHYAIDQLKRLKTIMLTHNKNQEWLNYISVLKIVHERKNSFLNLLSEV